MLPFWVICTLIFILTNGDSSGQQVESNSEYPGDVPKLLVVALDGLRYDFITERLMPNLYKMAQEGVWAVEGTTAVFPTETTPNFAALATGLYPESSGILTNKMRQRDGPLVFDIWGYSGNKEIQDGSLHPHWYHGTPFWQLNDRHSSHRRTGSHFWPLSDIPFDNNPTPAILLPFQERNETKELWVSDVDKVLGWFEEERINLGLLYFDNPDETEHGFPVESDAVKSVIKQLDDVIGRIAARTAGSSINIVVLSDHGHVTVDPATSVVSMASYLPREAATFIDYYPPGLYRNTTQHAIDWESVYTALKAHENEGHYNVYKRRDIPTYFHIANHPLVTDLIVVPEAGYYLDFGKAWTRKAGRHGSFSNLDKVMRSSFVAAGPAFKKGVRIAEPFENVNIYALLCAVLHVSPAPNNGSLAVLADVLVGGGVLSAET